MKPLLRWTIGPVAKSGFEILIESVNSFKKVYPEIDQIICFNHMNCPTYLSDLKIELYQQLEKDTNYPLYKAKINPKGHGMAASGWKLAPPRLRLEAPEIWVDNDILIVDRIPTLDHWLKNPMGGIIAEGVGRYYGIYEKHIPPKYKLCAGFFGLPPFFDFGEKILNYCQELNGEPLGSYNEQGLVATTIITTNNFYIIPLNELANCAENLPIVPTPAFHFIGTNRNKKEVWNEYKKQNNIETKNYPDVHFLSGIQNQYI